MSNVTRVSVEIFGGYLGQIIKRCPGYVELLSVQRGQ